MKKLSYEDWYNGNVTLKYANTIFIKGNKPKLVSWVDFDEVDVFKIREKQKEIFTKIVDSKLSSFKKQFSVRYNNSIFQAELLETERKGFANILNAPIPEMDLIVFKNINVLLKRNDLLEIQSYFENTIIGGRNNSFDFVQSPKDPYQDFDKTPSQAYALVCFKYLEWLIENFKVSDKTSKDVTKTLWFAVGLAFANGKMDDLLEKHRIGNNAPNISAIARELGNSNYRPYINETYNSKNNRQNIFYNKSKIEQILDYCSENNISIVESFEARIKDI